MRNAEKYLQKLEDKKSSEGWFMEVSVTLLTVLGSGALILGIIFLGGLVQGFVLSQLWSWYVVTHFHVSPLPIVVAWSISLMFHVMQIQIQTNLRSTWGWLWVSLWCLCLGWLGTWFL
jgi:hypothetical protein